MLKGHPKGLAVLFFANMGERFGYYTMLSIFVLYLQENFGWDAKTAGLVYGYFLFGIYFMPLLGGFLADKVLGYGKTVALGTVIMTLGYALLAVPTDMPWMVYASLAVISIGNGMFKGNLVVIVGNLYAKDRGSLRDAAFNIYYMGINIGAFFAPYAANGINELIRQIWGATLAQGYNAGFAVAGLGQILSLLIFLIFRKYYQHADYRAHEKQAGEEAEEILTPKQNRDRIAALLIVFAIVVFFWMAFHQNGFTLTLFAKNYTISQVSPLTYMFFNLPALLAIIAVILGLVFALRRKAAAWTRGLAAAAVVAGAAFGIYQYSSFCDSPDRELLSDRLADVRAVQGQKELCLTLPLESQAAWAGKLADIPRKWAEARAEELREGDLYARAGVQIPLLKIYRLYNDEVLTAPAEAKGKGFVDLLAATGLDGAAEIPLLYRKVSAGRKKLAQLQNVSEAGEASSIAARLAEQTDADEKELQERIAALGAAIAAAREKRAGREDGQADDPREQIEALFKVAQHLARVEEEALLVSRQAAEQARALGDEGRELMASAGELGAELAFQERFFRELAVALSKISDKTYGTSLVLKVPGRISPELFQSFNPIFIVFLTPLIVGFFAWLNRRKKEPSSPAKIGIGMLVTGLGFGVMVLAAWGLASPQELDGGRSGLLVTPYWLVATYFTLTVAELFLSPMGLSFVSKVAPPKLRGLMQGGWLGATAIGNLAAGLIGHFYESWELWQFFIMLVGAALLSALAVALLLRKLKAATES
ncbi:MAG: MFS transporter [Deltaproteobacteria bacterium]|nr:MFS transporter [Deltaproteobacteria bacterium]